MAWRKRGRPRLATARRRATTCAGRRSPGDLGSPELIKRKARVANGSAVPVELVDTAGILLVHHLIEPEELLILRLVSSWLQQVRVAFGLPAGSPGGLWNAITSGQRGGQWTPLTNTPGGARALFHLAQLYEHFAELHALDQLALVMRVTLAEAPPANIDELIELRSGLQTVMELQRRGRRRTVEAAPAPAPS